MPVQVLIAECTICQHTIMPVPREVIATVCGHLHHVACLTSWFESKKKADFCPVCRAKASLSTSIILTFDQNVVEESAVLKELFVVRDNNLKQMDKIIREKDVIIKREKEEKEILAELSDALEKRIKELELATRTKTVMCRSMFFNKVCKNGITCLYAHSPAEIPNYKRELCTDWLEKDNCAFGKLCSFAHGKHELITEGDNTNGSGGGFGTSSAVGIDAKSANGGGIGSGFGGGFGTSSAVGFGSISVTRGGIGSGSGAGAGFRTTSAVGFGSKLASGAGFGLSSRVESVPTTTGIASKSNNSGCENCGSKHHTLNQCQGSSQSNKICNTCSVLGHISRYCPTITCYNCGGSGHYQKDCDVDWD